MSCCDFTPQRRQQRLTAAVGAAIIVFLSLGVPSVDGFQLGLWNTDGDTTRSLGEGENGTHNETEHGEVCNVRKKTDDRFHVALFDFWNVSTPLLIALWILFVSLCKVGFHAQKTLSKLFPESCLLIVIGVILGIILYFAEHHSDVYQLNTHTFFLIILPPIIMDAGYFMPSRSFFDQFGTIILYAVLNTLVNAIWIGFTLWAIGLTGVYGDICFPILHALVFASLLAAVDPVAVLAVFESVRVNEMLYIIVFGEALLNDGIAVVLYHIFEGFSKIGAANVLGVDIVAGIGSFFVIVIGAPGIGILMGLFGGFCSRFTHHVRIMEPMIVVVICYMSFLIGEMFHLSGILSCTFCGITMRKYVEANISPKSQIAVKYIFKMLSSVAEAIIFMYLGIAAVSDARVWNTAFILLTLLFCIVYRVIGVVLLAWMANPIRLVQLTKIDQFIMSYGGLRGAIAFALSVLLEDEIFPSKHLLITATIVEVYFTNLIMGTTVEPLVKWLKVKRNDSEEPTMNEKIALRMMDHLMQAIEGVAQQKGHHHIREQFSHLNNKYLKPFIIGRHPRRQQHAKAPKGRGFELYRVYQRLSQKDAKSLTKNPNSARSLSRWNSVIMQNEASMDRSNTVYELPSYWRGSWVSMSDCESAAGVNMRQIPSERHVQRPEHVGNGSAGHHCKCNCHSPNATNGMTPNKSTDVLLLPGSHSAVNLSPGADVATTRFTYDEQADKKNLATSKRVSFNGMEGVADGTTEAHIGRSSSGSRGIANQYENLSAITFSTKSSAEPQSPTGHGEVKADVEVTNPRDARVYDNKAFSETIEDDDDAAAAEGGEKHDSEWKF